MGIVPVVLHHSTIQDISTIQINMPNNHRETDSAKTIELMFLEIMKRFEFGKTIKILHPLDDMEIEFDKGTEEDPGDSVDIKELIQAQEKINEEMMKPEINNIMDMYLEEYNKKMELKQEI